MAITDACRHIPIAPTFQPDNTRDVVVCLADVRVRAQSTNPTCRRANARVRIAERRARKDIIINEAIFRTACWLAGRILPTRILRTQLLAMLNVVCMRRYHSAPGDECVEWRRLCICVCVSAVGKCLDRVRRPRVREPNPQACAHRCEKCANNKQTFAANVRRSEWMWNAPESKHAPNSHPSTICLLEVYLLGTSVRC